MRPNLDQLAQLSQRLQEQEAQLRQKRQDLLALINASPEAIFLMRPDGAVILANEALARRVRTPVEQLPGRDIYSFLLPFTVADGRDHLGGGDPRASLDRATPSASSGCCSAMTTAATP